jgi:hypothetical protein
LIRPKFQKNVPQSPPPCEREMPARRHFRRHRRAPVDLPGRALRLY